MRRCWLAGRNKKPEEKETSNNKSTNMSRRYRIQIVMLVAFLCISLIVLPIIINCTYEMGKVNPKIVWGFSQGDILSYVSSAIALLVAVLAIIFTQIEVKKSKEENKKAIEDALLIQNIENRYERKKEIAKEIASIVSLKNYELYDYSDNSIIMMLERDLNRYDVHIKQGAYYKGATDTDFYAKTYEIVKSYIKILKNLYTAMPDDPKKQIELYTSTKKELAQIAHEHVNISLYEFLLTLYLEEMDVKKEEEIKQKLLL